MQSDVFVGINRWVTRLVVRTLAAVRQRRKAPPMSSVSAMSLRAQKSPGHLRARRAITPVRLTTRPPLHVHVRLSSGSA